MYLPEYHPYPDFQLVIYARATIPGTYVNSVRLSYPYPELL